MGASYWSGVSDDPYSRLLGEIKATNTDNIVSANVKVKNVKNTKISFKLSDVLLSAKESYEPFAYSDIDVPITTRRDITFDLLPGETKIYDFYYLVNRKHNNLDFKFKNLNPIQVKEIPDPRSIKLRLDELKAESVKVRQEAAKALGIVKNPTAVQPLINALNDEHPKVREEAVRALSELKARKAIPFLKKLSENDEDANVRAASKGALEKIFNKRQD